MTKSTLICLEICCYMHFNALNVENNYYLECQHLIKSKIPCLFFLLKSLKNKMLPKIIKNTLICLKIYSYSNFYA